MGSDRRRMLQLSGYAPALPTPFDHLDDIDRAALDWMCQRQIEQGATAVAVCGTTGEAPTLRCAEHDIVVRTAVAATRGRVPVIAVASSNSTSQAIELARDSEAAGADAILSVVPYYNKPTQAGMYAHFRAIAEATALPVILYDVPARTVCGLADDTVARLAELPQIIGLKDATGDVTRPLRLRGLVGSMFRLLSGDDATALAFLAQGGDGCISVTSNVLPRLCRAMYSACKHGELARAQQFAAPIARLTSVLFRESSPAPVKYALSRMVVMSARLRLPLVEPRHETKADIDQVLADLAARDPTCLVGNLRRQSGLRVRSVGRPGARPTLAVVR
jgi:4-hydroxy-tetrahydrodipicolinate synthase